MTKLIALAAIIAVTTGCVESLHDVYVSNFAPTEGKLVEVRSEQWTFMGFVDDTAYVDEAHASLIAKCPDGRLENITTQYSTDLGFFSWTNRVLMKGYCTQANAS